MQYVNRQTLVVLFFYPLAQFFHPYIMSFFLQDTKGDVWQKIHAALFHAMNVNNTD